MKNISVDEQGLFVYCKGRNGGRVCGVIIQASFKGIHGNGGLSYALEWLGYDQEPNSRSIEKVIRSKGARVIMKYERE